MTANGIFFTGVIEDERVPETMQLDVRHTRFLHRFLEFVPTFVPTQQTDGHIYAQTASHMLPSPLSCFVSVGTLKTGRLLSVVRLPWAQEAPGSNPGAPTKIISRIFFRLQ